MKFLIDHSAKNVQRKAAQFPELVMGQLLTPLTNYHWHGGTYAIDNGAFAGFNPRRFRRLLAREKDTREHCLFVCCPDIVGNARRTLELFDHRHEWLQGWPVALVAQNGIEDMDIPWDYFKTLFIGGQDPWKDSRTVADVVLTAKALGKWVHVGRVNSAERFAHFAKLGADSCDGSGVSMYDHMLQNIHNYITGPQLELDLETVTVEVKDD